jgi:hypothetical protein
MTRREFIMLLGGAAAAGPFAAGAQQGERMRRIGVLVPQDQDSPVAQARIAALLQELRQLGWTGRNARIDIHWAGADAESIRKHAAELATHRTSSSQMAAWSWRHCYRRPAPCPWCLW